MADRTVKSAFTVDQRSSWHGLPTSRFLAAQGRSMPPPTAYLLSSSCGCRSLRIRRLGLESLRARHRAEHCRASGSLEEGSL
jgi:hypothetical protein